ncbi:DUF512 domain-containing protein [Clostridium sp. 19966]|uniref:DUF512 domain-containing protein n=1 Tax=Clostridium sp. 19966 TaxID=2768166 RepID=UPI0028DF7436|nr:DUF512 domain-containing protein [Clostridium sp. 19966]MDT8718152.1 DUF512 domain-containing protein [Clostridium sp. 19966]
MSAKIKSIEKNSIAEELEFEIGDILLSINGNEVKDVIDYRFLMADEYVEVDIEKADGEIWTYEIEKEYQEDLGVEFENAIMDHAKRCHNNCVFCFIDQLPGGMRDTLYFKDDDSRLSFLQGNFVTLTNMSDDDIHRIIKYKISPINISVHTTNPQLRIQMLNNRFAGAVYERLKLLADAGIVMHCQVVCCPGINNGEELLRTVKDLNNLYPAVEDVAVVPVGITKHRKGLKDLTVFTRETAAQELDNVKELQEKYMIELGTPFVRLSDEFYVLAGKEVPNAEFYSTFHQLEDGIGMIRILRDTINKDVKKLKKNISGNFLFATGVSAFDEIKWVSEKVMNENSKLNLKVKKIINNFFGSTITVAGLLTGGDIIDQLKNETIEGPLILPENMLKSGERIFLDDVSVEEMEKVLHRQVIICDYTGKDLIDIINRNSKEEK